MKSCPICGCTINDDENSCSLPECIEKLELEDAEKLLREMGGEEDAPPSPPKGD